MSCASSGLTVPYFNSTLLSNYTLTGKQDSLQQIITLFEDCCPKRKAVCWGTSWSTSVTHLPRHETWQFFISTLGHLISIYILEHKRTQPHSPPGSSISTQEAGTSATVLAAWPCLAARTVLPSSICQLTCSDHWFLTHLSQKQLDWWSHVNKLDVFGLQEFLGKLGDNETHS